jgi:hypothetical protein
MKEHLTFKDARKYPPLNNYDYKQAVTAEMLACTHGLSAETLYGQAQALGKDIYADYAVLSSHKGACERLLKGEV